MEIVLFVVGLLLGAGAVYMLLRPAHRREVQVYADTMARQREDAERERARDMEQLSTGYERQIQLMAEQLRTSTRQMIDDGGKGLLEANTAQMSGILSDLRQRLDTMDRRLQETNEKTVETGAKVEGRIAAMLQQTQSLGQQAERLANALQHDNKVAGNWGELILAQLLESQGLQRGVHFDEQATLRDASGQAVHSDETHRRMIPDVILHLADNRDLIVDSKLSLQAFVDYCNAETDAERQDAARRHVESVRAHVRGLRARNYTAYVQPPKVCTDFVLMFVPVEGALQLTMAEDPDLWRDAFDKKVFIVGAQTLMAALRIIDLTWVNVLQERNTQAVIDEARKMVDRVDGFLKAFDELGTRLQQANAAYDQVKDRARDGRQSILGAGRRIEALGARGKRPLPSSDQQ